VAAVVLHVSDRELEIDVLKPKTGKLALYESVDILNGEDIRPTLVDLDNDGLEDIIIGKKDGTLDFNLDVIGEPFIQSDSKTKMSLVWFQALQEAIVNKRNMNGQFALIAKYFLNETKGIDKPEFIKTVKSTMKNMKPLYEYLKSKN